MKKLSDLFAKKDDPDIPDDFTVECYDCGWKGTIADCDSELTSDGWEYPEYMSLDCPLCGGLIDV